MSTIMINQCRPCVFLRTIKKRLPNIIRQEFHTATVVLKENKYLGRQATMLKKLMTGSNRSRSKFFNVDQTPAKQFAELQFLGSSSSGKKRPVSGRAQKRVKVLNVLFIEQITSMLSTGEVGAKVIELGLEIISVKVSQDFSRVCIYWQPTGTEKDQVFESLLPGVAGHLRHELTQLRVIGNVPPIEFVKDPVQDRISQVEIALAKCDFGPDYEPTAIGDAVKRMKLVPVNPKAKFSSELSSQIEIMTENKLNSDSDKVATPEEIEEQIVKVCEDDILSQSLDNILYGPEMRNDILGLDQAAIMKKISHAVLHKGKAKPDHTQDIELSHVSSTECTIAELADEGNRTKDFLKYLEKKKRDRLKQLKLDSTQASDQEFRELQLLERWQEHQDKSFSKFGYEVIEHPDETLDYIEEEDTHTDDNFKIQP